MEQLTLLLRGVSIASGFAILAVLVRRRLFRRYWAFSAYLIAVIGSTISGLLFRGSIRGYFEMYWSTEVLTGLLALVAIDQVFKATFRESTRDFPWLRFLVPILAVVVAATNLAYAWHHQSWMPTWFALLYAFDFAVHFVEGAILILCVLLQKAFAAVWSRTDFGLLAGFGISASVTMLADYLGVVWPRRFEPFFKYAPASALIVAELVWLHAVSLTNPSRLVNLREIVELLRRDIRNARWLWKQEAKSRSNGKD